MSHESRRIRARRTLADAFVFFAASAALLYPIWLAYMRYGVAAPFKFFASDAFYYLNIARRSQALAFYSFDGTRATNGFHPLWQWLVTELFRLTGLTAASDQQLLLVYCTCAVLTAIGFGFLAVSATRLIRYRTLALLFTIPGCIELLLSRPMVSTLDATEAVPWHVVNGMETGLSVCLFGILVWLLLRGPSLQEWSLPRLVAISVLVSLSILSRLDDVFLLVAITGGALLVTAGHRRRWLTVLALTAIPAAVLCGYLAYNLATTDLLLPVSSSMKRDSGALASTLRNTVELFVPTKMFLQQLYVWDAINWRVLQLLVPIAVATVFIAYGLLVREFTDADPQGRHTFNILMILAGYVLMKGGYNLVAVPLFAQGHWYFPLSIASANLMLADLIGRTVRWQLPQIDAAAIFRVRPILRWLGIFAAGLGLALAVVSYSRGRLLFAVLAVAAPGLVLALFTDRLLTLATNVSPATRRRLQGILSAAVTGSFLLLYGNAIVSHKVSFSYTDVNFGFWRARHEIARQLASVSPSAKLVELDDGIMAYALDIPVMSGFGLAADAGAYPACRAQRCLDVAYERGHRVVSSVQYWSFLNHQQRDFRSPSDEQGVLDTLVGSRAIEAPHGSERFDFTVLLSVDVGEHIIHFLEFKPK